jgi:hypothetical protein
MYYTTVQSCAVYWAAAVDMVPVCSCYRRHPCKLWDHSHSMDVHPPLWLQKMPSLTGLVIDVPGSEHAWHAPSLEA